MGSTEMRLGELFKTCFDTTELRLFARYKLPQGVELTDAVVWNGPSAAVFADFTAVLLRRGVSTLWEPLIAERPEKHAEIAAVKALFLGTTAGPSTGPGAGAPDWRLRPGERLVVLMVTVDIETAVNRRVRADREHREIKQRLRLGTHGQNIELTLLTAARWDECRQELMRLRPHILHFSGHGTAAGELQFAGPDEQPLLESPEKIAEALRILRDNLRCVVLNACSSATLAGQIHQNIPSVIGMGAEITDDSAIRFSTVFYEGIAFGRTVRESFDLAVNEVRSRGEKDVPRLFPF